MLKNRSMPESTVIPVLEYPDVAQAVEWLCQAFGFTVCLRIGSHRAQLNTGQDALVIREGSADGSGYSIMIRVGDVDRHCDCARRHGAIISQEAADQPYGERQYGAVDFAGRHWTFSQTIADIDPQDWGGKTGGAMS